jgi:hypothetical protein
MVLQLQHNENCQASLIFGGCGGWSQLISLYSPIIHRRVRVVGALRPYPSWTEDFGEGLWLRGRGLARGIAVDSGDVRSEESEDPRAAYANCEDCVELTESIVSRCKGWSMDIWATEDSKTAPYPPHPANELNCRLIFNPDEHHRV